MALLKNLKLVSKTIYSIIENGTICVCRHDVSLTLTKKSWLQSLENLNDHLGKKFAKK